MAYGNDPANDVNDEVRLLIGDTDNTDLMLSDEEIEYAVLKHDGNAFYAGADLCEVLASKFAKSVNLSVEGLSASFAQRFDHYNQRAVTLRKLAKNNARIAGPRFSEEFTSRKAVFDIGMHDMDRSDHSETRSD